MVQREGKPDTGPGIGPNQGSLRQRWFYIITSLLLYVWQRSCGRVEGWSVVLPSLLYLFLAT